MILICFAMSCDDFVDVSLPKNQLTSVTVFEDAATASAALRSIYSEMRDNGLVSRLRNLMGLYTDELDPFGSIDTFFYNHNVTALNANVSNWWSHTFNLIYEANAVVEGVENSTTLSLEDKNQLKGEALFIRAYLHSLLVELFGPVPYVRTTDYIVNTSVSRIPVSVVYNHIITDLILATELLGEDISGERVRPYKAVAEALLARVYLYTQQWSDAETMASKVIDRFILEPDLDKVFLKNSSGSIWQFKPANDGENADEGANFIFVVSPGTKPILSPSILNAFETFMFPQPGDQRRVEWVKEVSNGSDTWYHANKYKQEGNTFLADGETLNSEEYSVVFRLAEQYLIRAEARAEQEKISDAQTDINIIRTRAELPNTTADSKDELVDAILHERQVELFTEGGHRWFDLKRTGKASEVLTLLKPNWRDTDILLPIPEDEILLNPNLLPQNNGY